MGDVEFLEQRQLGEVTALERIVVANILQWPMEGVAKVGSSHRF
jgi:hypothetical protein